MEEQIVYFEKPGQENTSAVFDVVDRALSELDIHKVVLASTRGDTARFAMDRYKGQAHCAPDRRPPPVWLWPGTAIPAGTRRARPARGARGLLWDDALSPGKDLWPGPGTVGGQLFAAFCQGVKVCVEILLMAGNAGLVDEEEQVVVVAGTGRGADTALVMTGATSGNLKAMHISRVLCKPL